MPAGDDAVMNILRMPAYAGATTSGAARTPSFGVLASRRNRFWFGVVGLLALCLPYAALATASAKAALNPPDVVTPLPNVVLPAVRFPVLAVPKAAHAARRRSGPSQAGAGAGAGGTGSASRPASASRRLTPSAGTRHLVRQTGARRVTRQQIPVQRSSYSLTSAPTSTAPTTASGVIGGLAHALSAAPIVVNTQPLPPLPTPPPPVVVPAPSAGAPAPSGTPVPTVTVNGGPGTTVTSATNSTSHLSRAHLAPAASSAEPASTPSSASSPSPAPAPVPGGTPPEAPTPAPSTA
ncbi:MAG: hypothetical protein QOF83_119 [Solirubrobacteraceae bacterium]|nr:hypothetical protein [Solirubrobacteraceae bacterium]